MKKFSLLLIGAFLLWTITFVLADETKDAEATTWATAEATETTATEGTTWATAEATETTATEATTWATAEATETTATEATTWDTAEATETETTWATTDTASETTAANTTENAETNTTDSTKAKYDEEQVAAYEWALEKGITTINDIEKARLTDWLTRAELAKMMSQYMTNVLGKTPAEAEKANYADVNESLGDLADFIQTAYAYKIMWVNADGTPLKNFNPKGKVTRAEYATVFSRVLYGDKYNKSEWNYYEDHLKALKEAGILSNTEPTIKEMRGWVMLMMYRSTNVKIETPAEESTGTVIGMANPASVYCEEQGGTLTIVEDKEGNQSGMCKLADGTEVEEWEYYRANHKDETATTWDVATWDVAPLYTAEDLKAAEKTITEEGFGKMTVKVENVKLTYMGDEKSTSELKYCQELDATVEECAVYESEFYIPQQDAQMAWAFEPDTTLTGYQWYLGRTKGGEWKILTMGY